MKNLRLRKYEFEQIEKGIQVDVLIGGFPAYCIRNEYGDFHTPNGIRFEINFYSLNNFDLLINGEDQSTERTTI